MPRVTRSKKQAPLDASMSTTSTALQPKSTNSLKRPLSDDSSKKGKEVDAAAQKSKRPATTSSFIAARNADALAASWDVEGVYKITNCYVHMKPKFKLKFKGFSFKLFHSTHEPDDSQWYADFRFGEVQGIMRLCPRKPPGSKPNDTIKLAAFERACSLRRNIEPGPDYKTWLMRWRGKAGGLLVDKHVGGEDEINCAVEFMRDVPSSTEDFRGLKIVFCWAYDGNIFLFDALKTANLTEEACSPSSLKDKWGALWNTDWEDSDDDSDDLESGPQVKSELENVPARKARRGRGKPASAQSDKPAPRGGTKAEQERNLISRQLDSVPQQVIPGARGFKKVIETPPDWSWDVAGHWEVKDSPWLRECLGVDDEAPLTMTFRISNNPLHTRVSRQLWATFDFGKELWGVMRFSPKNGPISNHPDTLKKFEQECVLQSGCWPGDSPQGQNEWYIRWRGRTDIFTTVDGSDQWQGESKFKKDKSGKLIFESTFMHLFQPVVFKAEKVRPRTPSKVTEGTILTCWHDYRPDTGRRGHTYVVSANSNWPYS
ncbi:hypothetical protein BDZ45DRAFT_677460 [Acephala macrosclerotiorum]|nr:hypothetical protein BDZ45DRAFT_677460 [Acephala macrosclerotiorum]